MSSIFEEGKIFSIAEQDETVVLSNSLAILLGSYQEALIVQRLHSWTLADKGVVINGERWQDRTIEDWIMEILPTTNRKMRTYMSSLVSKGVLERREHQDHKYTKKNRTYYYRLNYERLSELTDAAIASKNLNNDGGQE